MVTNLVVTKIVGTPLASSSFIKVKILDYDLDAKVAFIIVLF
ncbi:MAG: hypothetical protein ACI9EW_003043 [Cellvibrionaceae bacterium]|jgi:hypothetical protein